jgi:hypothetical protein
MKHGIITAIAVFISGLCRVTVWAHQRLAPGMWFSTLQGAHEPFSRPDTQAPAIATKTPVRAKVLTDHSGLGLKAGLNVSRESAPGFGFVLVLDVGHSHPAPASVWKIHMRPVSARACIDVFLRRVQTNRPLRYPTA